AARRDLGAARGVTALAVAALLAGGCAARASLVQHEAPGAGAAAAAAPSATAAADPAPSATVASPGTTSAAGPRPAPAEPRHLITGTAASYPATSAALAPYR